MVAIMLSSLALAAGAADSAAPAKSPAPAPTAAKAPPPETEIPKSTFVVPSNLQQGKDPFYPLSTRLFPRPVTVSSNNEPAPAVAVVELQLKSLSGVPGRRFAIINNHTFESGEEADVITNLGRAKVRCLEIKDDSVLVQVGAEQRLLKLRSGL